MQIDSDEDDDEDDDAPAPADGMDVVPPSSSAAGPGDSSPSRRPRPEGGDDDGDDDEDGDRETTPRPAPPKKVKISITYDKYMLIMQKVVYHLAEVERTTDAGLPRNELKAWYLEEMEEQFTSTEDMEQEIVLIDRVLTKLVKVSLCQVHNLR